MWMPAAGAAGEAGTHDRRTHVIGTSDIGAFRGLDVGKYKHHATAVTPAGKKAFDNRLPNSEPKLRELFERLQAKHGTVLVVVDQPASIGALPLTVARDAGCQVAHLPDLTMRRIADLYPARPRPTPATPSSRTPSAPCRTRSAPSSWKTRPSPSWR